MEFRMLRGQVEQMSAPEKNGSVNCRINGSRVNLHRHLVENVGEGENVMIAGEYKSDTLFALAVKNLAREKTTQVEVVMLILLAMVSGFIGLLFAGFIIDSYNEITALMATFAALSVLGLSVGALFIRRFLFVNDCVNAVDHSD